jgi:hypothetical protein
MSPSAVEHDAVGSETEGDLTSTASGPGEATNHGTGTADRACDHKFRIRTRQVYVETELMYTSSSVDSEGLLDAHLILNL